jgi:hypothetical protein
MFIPQLNLRSIEVQVFADASWAASYDSGGRSVTGGVVVIADGVHAVPVWWRSAKQHSISCSSGSAELKALHEVLVQTVYIRSMLQEMVGDLGYVVPVRAFTDSATTIDLLDGRTEILPTDKSLLVRVHALRETLREDCSVTLSHISTQVNPADDFTKPTAGLRISALMRAEGVVTTEEGGPASTASGTSTTFS